MYLLVLLLLTVLQSSDLPGHVETSLESESSIAEINMCTFFIGLFLSELSLEIHLSEGHGWFKPAKCLCLSQSRSYISNTDHHCFNFLFINENFKSTHCKQNLMFVLILHFLIKIVSVVQNLTNILKGCHSYYVKTLLASFI